MIYLPSKFFQYNAATHTFTAEASELDHASEDGNWIGRIYPDSADAGFAMVSGKTGEHVVFCEKEIQRQFGDIVSWDFEPTPESIRKFPHLKGCKVIVFND